MEQFIKYHYFFFLIGFLNCFILFRIDYIPDQAIKNSANQQWAIRVDIHYITSKHRERDMCLCVRMFLCVCECVSGCVCVRERESDCEREEQCVREREETFFWINSPTSLFHMSLIKVKDVSEISDFNIFLLMFPLLI